MTQPDTARVVADASEPVPAVRGAARARFVMALKLALAAGLIYWLLASGRLDLSQLRGVWAHWPWLVAAQLSYALAQVMATLRWRLLLRAQGIEYSVANVGALTLISLFFNQVVLGATGGDFYRAYAAASENEDRRSGAVISVFMDRAMGFTILLAIAAAGLLLNFDLVREHVEIASFAVILGGGLLVALVALAILLSRRARETRIVAWGMRKLPLQRVLQSADEALLAYRTRERELAVAVAYSIALHGLVVLTNILLATALMPEGFDAWRFFVLIPMAHVAMTIPLNPPGAIGTAEAIYGYLLGLVGIPNGSLVCLLQRLTFYGLAVPGAILYVLRRGAVRASGAAEVLSARGASGSGTPTGG